VAMTRRPRSVNVASGSIVLKLILANANGARIRNARLAAMAAEAKR
jgi:hypothetical protein